MQHKRVVKCPRFMPSRIPHKKEEIHKTTKEYRMKKVTKMCAPVRTLRKKTAQELLEFCGQDQSVPVDLNAILNKVGISALPKDFSEIESKVETPVKILGAIVTSGDNAAIFYNKEDRADSHRCRFTVAHELAHCCLSHECLNDEIHVDLRLGPSELDDNADEREANIFAGELLIPYDMLDKVIDELLLPSVHNLADIFDVSDNVMFARLQHLKMTKRVYGYNC